MLRDDEAENLQRSQSILGTNRLPEVLQGYPRTLSLLRRKKVPSGWSRITFLLERFVDWLRTNLRASKERRQTIQESHQVSQSSSADGHYDGCFWGDRAHLDRFFQTYAVERAKLEARKAGHSVTEESLQDGSIRLRIGQTA